MVAHLAHPTEKLWGILLELDLTGMVLRGISVTTFDEWMFQAARRDEPMTLGLSTMFVPLARVERIFLDEQVGEVQSYRQRFAREAGVTVESFLGLEEDDGEVPS